MSATPDGRRSAGTAADRSEAPRTPPRQRVAGVLIRVLIVAGLVTGFAYNLVGLPGLRDFGFYYRLDLDVYRLGGSVFLHGPTLYGSMPPTQMGNFLPFTYPPLAAVVFSPLSLVSLEAAGVVVTVLSLVALFGALLVTLDSLGIAPRTTLVWTALGGLAVATALEPVSSTLDYGQINILLMALVAFDCLAKRTPLPRGVLIGLAAAVKLTPAVFVLYFLLRKDFRAAVTTAAAFVAFSAVGAIATWSDSVTYWTRTLFDSGRIGTPAYPANQSITGVLARFDVSESLRTPIWLLLSLGVLAVAIVAMLRTLRAGEAALALGVNAVLGLLVSPVSWSHHWVWSVPIILTLGVLAYRGRSIALGLVAVAGLAVIKVAAHWKLGVGRWSGVHWSVWDHFLASSYVWWGLAVVAVAFVTFGTAASRPDGDERRTPSGDVSVPVA
ncbi:MULTISPECIES: glycosyltransferase 87 family protein [Rhodococcus]|uniref:glycosyltransferase 87 family protein n=1 Tax=Rhodococcus TaxID=1827 RepID=UPI002954DD55|nr:MULTISPECIES: glycosyltransferase 87 family protein [Rhodococcus]MDV7274566.1 glycosyltransferase 87 family protein [Rhodococcus oxybenzonivorans]MDV8029203.1 glycosyltransferase 87 family protein [Rhodococcus sp. IEGM 27]